MLNSTKASENTGVPNHVGPNPTDPDSGTNDYGEKKVVDPMADAKQEILEANARQLQTIQNTILQQTQSMIQGALNARETSNEEEDGYEPSSGGTHPALKEFREEIDSLNIEDDQMVHLMNVVKKIIHKEAPQLEKKMKTDIKKETNDDARKAELNRQIASQYPLDRTSPLFLESQRVMQEFEENKDPILQSPTATAMAVREAAGRLGLAPQTLEDIRRREAAGPVGSGSGEDNDKEISEKSIDFGAAFGISPEKMKEKLEIVKARKAS